MMRSLLAFAAVLLVTGCTSVEEVALKTAENVARAACSAARNCANTCADGSTASPYTYSCPGRP